MLGRNTLLVNPPLINGIAFTRQGRCQEREEVLGTTKPPYSLVVLAALLRERQHGVRLLDLTAERLSTQEALERLIRENFAPTLIIFCSTTPTLDADVVEMAKLKRAFDAPLVCFGPHASCAPTQSMERAPAVDVMIVGEPEDAVLALAGLDSLDGAEMIPSVTFRRDGAVVPHRERGAFEGFLRMPYPAWDLIDFRNYTLPLVARPYALIETSRGCPYSCDFCVVPLHQGHKFRERDPKSLVDEMQRGKREHGLQYFYLWGDTVTLNVKTFAAFCEELIARKLGVKWFGNARADNLNDPAFVKLLKRSGCWMLSMGIESASDDIRKEMLKRLESQKIQTAFTNLREAGIKSFAFFIYGTPATRSNRWSEPPSTRSSWTQISPTSIPPCRIRAPSSTRRPGVKGCCRSRTGAAWSTRYYLMTGNGVNADEVMRAIRRARRKFLLRRRYLSRHVGDLFRLGMTKPALAWHMTSRTFLGSRVPDIDTKRTRAVAKATPTG